MRTTGHPKRILVLHFPSLDNYGTAMMGINALQCLHDYGGANWEFLCDFSDPMRTDLLFAELGVGPWRISRFPGMPEDMQSVLFKAIRLLRPVMRARWLTRQCDAIVILGGDDFSEHYGGLNWRTMLNLYLCGHGIPVVFLAQTIGPFSSLANRLLAKLALRSCRFIARDPWTIEYLVDGLGIPSAELGADLAWIDLPHQHHTGLFEETAVRLGLEREGYVSVVVSCLWIKYAKNLDCYLDRSAEIVAALLRHKDLDGRKVCLLPHTISAPYGDERDLIRRVLERLPANLRLRAVTIEEALYPTKTRLILGNGLFTITGRMHAAVSTLQMGRPAISLAYSAKYEGVIGRAMGRNDLLVAGAAHDKWQDGRIVREVLERVDYILSEEQVLRQEIGKAAERQKTLAKQSIQGVAEWISRS